MKRESFIVYKSFHALIRLLPEKERLKMYESIFDYGLEEKEPTFKDEASKAIWTSILPQLRANNRRYENGLKGAEFGKDGGRPKKEKNNNEKTPNKTPNENVNENVNDIYLSNACAHVENENLNTFLARNPKISNDTSDINGIDFCLLEEKIKESKYLQSVTSLDWFVSNYEKVIAGKYKTFKVEDKAFENQRTYSAEELNEFKGFEEYEKELV